MIAALPMYDWPALRPATDAFWAAVAGWLAAHGIAAPAALSRPRDAAEAWRHPDLLIGQTCGMPWVSGLCGAARLVARPDYGLADAGGGAYRSVIVGRAGDAGGAGGGAREDPEALLARQGGRVAVNEWGSFSGHIALRAHLAGLRDGAAGPFFGAAVPSGSHRASARLVARGDADVAALDAVAWALLEAHEPETARRLAILDRTAPAPALPYITAPRFAALGPLLAEALDAAARAA
ncbi:MAG TPA: PhnD/SsuA/transferrin family substrate-binding protein, partial [Thermohalobaculum sp.]|nr:PhnD/SsuA/transferrin family substrate-binding protein [Thermohalobaculum sp.]